jgi:hypothetical protein
MAVKVNIVACCFIRKVYTNVREDYTASLFIAEYVMFSMRQMVTNQR